VFITACFMLIHYITYDSSASQKMLSHIVNVTKLSSPSLSVAYYEPRVLFRDEVVNPVYPQMQIMNKMDFVYGK